jgi:hypothetical protein
MNLLLSMNAQYRLTCMCLGPVFYPDQPLCSLAMGHLLCVKGALLDLLGISLPAVFGR